MDACPLEKFRTLLIEKPRRPLSFVLHRSLCYACRTNLKAVLVGMDYCLLDCLTSNMGQIGQIRPDPFLMIYGPLRASHTPDLYHLYDL